MRKSKFKEGIKAIETASGECLDIDKATRHQRSQLIHRTRNCLLRRSLPLVLHYGYDTRTSHKSVFICCNSANAYNVSHL